MKNTRKAIKRQREYARTTDKKCLARGSHLDGMALVEYLMNSGGITTNPAEQIARDLGWEKRVGSARVTDMKRFHIARNHIKDGRGQDAKPCTGYSLHYRHSGADSVWKLVDPSGSLTDHIYAAAEEIRGDLHQQLAFRTVNGRRIATAEQMAEWCLKAVPQDGIGHRLMLEYSMELRKFGAVSDALLGEINLWLAGVVA